MFNKSRYRITFVRIRQTTRTARKDLHIQNSIRRSSDTIRGAKRCKDEEIASHSELITIKENNWSILYSQHLQLNTYIAQYHRKNICELSYAIIIIESVI